MANCDASTWPTVASVDEDKLRQRLVEWWSDPDRTETATVHAAAAAGHITGRIVDVRIWWCSCGMNFRRDLTAFVAHQLKVACVELERLGFLPTGSADVAAALYGEGAIESLYDLETTVRGIMS